METPTHTIIEILTIITMTAAIVAGMVRFSMTRFQRAVKEMHERLEAEVRDRTQQIQPGANGGSSLADANRSADKLDASLKRIHVRLDAMEQRSVEQSRDMDHLLEWASGRPCLWQIDRNLAKARDEAERREHDA